MERKWHLGYENGSLHIFGGVRHDEGEALRLSEGWFSHFTTYLNGNVYLEAIKSTTAVESISCIQNLKYCNLTVESALRRAAAVGVNVARYISCDIFE